MLEGIPVVLCDLCDGVKFIRSMGRWGTIIAKDRDTLQRLLDWYNSPEQVEWRRKCDAIGDALVAELIRRFQKWQQETA